MVTSIGLVQTGLSARTLSMPFVSFVPAWITTVPAPTFCRESEPVTSRSPVALPSSFVPPALGMVNV